MSYIELMVAYVTGPTYSPIWHWNSQYNGIDSPNWIIYFLFRFKVSTMVSIPLVKIVSLKSWTHWTEIWTIWTIFGLLLDYNNPRAIWALIALYNLLQEFWYRCPTYTSLKNDSLCNAGWPFPYSDLKCLVGFWKKFHSRQQNLSEVKFLFISINGKLNLISYNRILFDFA